MLAARPAEPAEVAYLWPCNVAAWGVWCDVQTQWLRDQGHIIGLSYPGVRAHLDELGLAPGDERRDIYNGIRAAERATLEARAELEAQKPQQ